MEWNKAKTTYLLVQDGHGAHAALDQVEDLDVVVKLDDRESDALGLVLLKEGESGER